MLIKNRKWKLLTSASIFFMVLIIFFEIIPRFAGIASSALKLYEQESALREAEKNAGLEKSLILENKAVKAGISSMLSKYEGGGRVSSIISLLDAAAAESGTDIISIKPEKEIKKDNLWLQPFEINLVSEYENVYNFFNYIEKSSKVIKIRQVDIKTEKLKYDSLLVKASLEVYLNL